MPVQIAFAAAGFDNQPLIKPFANFGALLPWNGQQLRFIIIRQFAFEIGVGICLHGPAGCRQHSPAELC